MRALNGFAQALIEDCAERLPETSLRYLRGIKDAAARGDVLITELLGYIRRSQGEMPLAPTDLDDVVTTACAGLAAEIARTRAQVTVERPLGTVLAHAPTLVEVVTRLLSNAVRFVAPSVPPAVRLTATETAGRVRLTVEDNGIGIAPAHRERIFRLFDRLHTGAEYPGMGVGLAVVQLTVRRMGGRVAVDAAPGGGSRFWIELAAARTS
jgi:signal transduction histidine kinase